MRDWWDRQGALPNEGPAVPPLDDGDRIRHDINRLKAQGVRLDPPHERLVEHLAARCPHTPDPCQRCTDLALWASLTLAATTRSASISAPIPLPTPTHSPTPRNAA